MRRRIDVPNRAKKCGELALADCRLCFSGGCSGIFPIGYRLALAPNEGFMNIGLNFDYSVKWMLTAYLPKFAAAMGVGLLLVKRAQQTQTELLHAGYGR